jgi:hypothetical protein
MSPGAHNMKTGPDDLGTTDNKHGDANMKTGADAHGIAENALGSAKHENAI